MSRTLVIGDVHGCCDALERLLEAASYAPEDEVIFVGDLVDKGPDIPGAVRLARSLRRRVLVMGNHEERFLRFRRHAVRVAGTGVAHPMAGSGGWDEWVRMNDTLDPEDLAFLETAVLYHLPAAYAAVVVHAGIAPSVDRLPEAGELATMSSWQRQRYKSMLRVRYVAPSGGMIKHGEEQSGDAFWACRYDGRFGHVYYGHEAVLSARPRLWPHATGIDLGAVYGGSLCAAVLEQGEPVRFVVVEGWRPREPA